MVGLPARIPLGAATSMARNNSTASSLMPYVALLVIFLLILGNVGLQSVPLLNIATTRYHTFLVDLILIYMIAILGVNVIMGYAGLVAISHAAVMAIGAYTSALFMVELGFPFVAAFALAMVVGAVTGAALGYLGSRVGGYLFLLVTFGFHQAVFLVNVNFMSGLTGGALGLDKIPPASIFGQSFKTDADYFFVIMPVFVIALFLAQKLRESRLGRAMQAVRQSEPAAAASGVNVRLYKILAMSIGSVYLAAAGALFAHLLRFLGPESFNLDLGLRLWLIVVLGGLGSMVGVAVAAGGVFYLLEQLKPLGEWWILIFGMTIMGIVVIAPGGIAGLGRLLVQRTQTRIRRLGQASAEQAATPGLSERAKDEG